MPIHDQSYRHFEGAKAPPGRAWLVIAKAGDHAHDPQAAVPRACWSSPGCRSSFRAGQIYFSTNFPQMAMLAPTAETFREFSRSRTASSSS